jgi:hypothetical protein
VNEEASKDDQLWLLGGQYLEKAKTRKKDSRYGRNRQVKNVVFLRELPESKMSDIKAKAEARRAKILARDKSKTVSAVSTEEDVISFVFFFFLFHTNCLAGIVYGSC